MTANPKKIRRGSHSRRHIRSPGFQGQGAERLAWDVEEAGALSQELGIREIGSQVVFGDRGMRQRSPRKK
jgi:hypothetical protein